MKPVYQTRFGSIGNCYTACVASILEVSLEELSEHERLYQEYARAHEERRYKERDDWFDRLRGEQWRLGFIPVVIPHFYKPKGYAIKSGMGSRGLLHCCVALDGEIVHDPHPSDEKLTTVEDYEVLLSVVPGT